MSRYPIPWTPADIPNLTGRTVLITGANSGLGLESTRLLAQRGAHVIMACRSWEKGQAAMESLQSQDPDADLSLMQLDLADLASVRDFARRIHDHYPHLDILLNNAGIMAPPLQLTQDGFEMQFGTNHLGHFALTGLLLDRLRAAEAARVVVLSSLAHRFGRLDFDNLDARRGYQRWRFYGQSKLANLMFALELDRRLRRSGEAIQSIAVHPGYSATNLQRTIPGHSLLNAVTAQSQQKGAYPSIFAASSPQAEAGHYYGPHGFQELWGMPAEASVSRLARNQEVARKLWSVSQDLTDVPFTGLDG